MERSEGLLLDPALIRRRYRWFKAQALTLEPRAVPHRLQGRRALRDWKLRRKGIQRRKILSVAIAASTTKFLHHACGIAQSELARP